MIVYKEIARLLKENVTYDWVEDDRGYPSINWLVAVDLLESYDEYTRYRAVDGMVNKVKASLYFALSYAESFYGLTVYSIRTKNNEGKHIAYLTIDPEYFPAHASAPAKACDYRRRAKQAEDVVTRAKIAVGRRTPELLADYKKRIAGRLGLAKPEPAVESEESEPEKETG